MSIFIDQLPVDAAVVDGPLDGHTRVTNGPTYTGINVALVTNLWAKFFQTNCYWKISFAVDLCIQALGLIVSGFVVQNQTSRELLGKGVAQQKQVAEDEVEQAFHC